MNSPYKMKGKSPMMKALIGKQNRLPAELKAKILASPAKKYKSDAQRKAVHASKSESPAKMYGKKSPAKNKVVDTLKKVYKETMPKVLQDVNKKIVTAVTGKKSKGASKAAKKIGMLTKKLKKVSPKGKYTTKENPVSRPDNKYEREGDKQFNKKSPAKNYKKGYYGA